MTNKEKQQYLSDINIYRSTSYPDEIGRKREFLEKMPTHLFKYAKYNKHTYDMLEKSYVYLAPVKGLDDPFDCLTDLGVDNIVERRDKSITLSMIDFVINTVSKLGNVNFDKKMIRNIVKNSFVDGEFVAEKYFEQVKQYPSLSEHEINLLSMSIATIDPMVREFTKDEKLLQVALTLKNSGNAVGVCSLSAKRDNKVMWSLYSNEYDGCCIEYQIPDNDDVRYNLCPVIYKKHINNNFVKRTIEFAVANSIRHFSEGNLNRGIGAFNELFCTKDFDWAYQDEWRLLGDPAQKTSLLKTKAVYLGFKTSKYKISKIKKFARLNKFDVYLMERPNGSNKIKYKLL